jgi:lysophospholipase L1-like esterase
MPRPLCIQYPGAIPHVMSRDDHRDRIFKGNDDIGLKLWAGRLAVMAAVLLPAITAGAWGKLGAMGDSLTDEYWDSGVSSYATNWPSLVVNYRGIDMGPTAAQAGVGTWGSPRNQGYKYNWALSGATSASLLSAGQATGLASQPGSDGVANAVLAIGSNDFNPDSSSAYLGIYFGLWNAAQIQAYANQIVANIETALVTVKTAGVSVVVANVLDPGLTPAVASYLTDGVSRDRVAAAVQTVNSGLKTLAQKYEVPLLDWYGLQRAIFGPNTNLHTTLKVGNVSLNLRGSDPGPPNSAPTDAFVADGFHPNTTMQGLFANTILQGFDSGYSASLALFTEQEILSHAQISYGGSDTLASQIGAYSNYVILPVLPRFTAISVAGTNVALRFSSVSNQLYIVESRDDLGAGSWATVSNNFPGSGGIVAVTNQVPAALTKRFYRVRQLP